jgi:hypothetical protein
MGVGISYTSMRPVAADVKAQLMADVDVVGNARDWWSEGFWLDDEVEEPGRLYSLHGFTKLFLPGYSTDAGGYQEVDGEEDYLLAWSDANFIVTHLCLWSKGYGVDWSIDLEGPIGSIVDGKPDKKLAETLQAMSESAIPKTERLRIRHKYATRNETDYVAWENEEPPPVHEVYPVETLEDREPPPVHDVSSADSTKPWWRFW